MDLFGNVAERARATRATSANTSHESDVSVGEKLAGALVVMCDVMAHLAPVAPLLAKKELVYRKSASRAPSCVVTMSVLIPCRFALRKA